MFMTRHQRQAYTELAALRSKLELLDSESQQLRQRETQLTALLPALPESAYAAYDAHAVFLASHHLENELLLASRQVESLASANEETNASICEVSSGVEQLHSQTEDLGRQLERGLGALDSTEGEMQAIATAADQLNRRVGELQEQVEQVVEVVEVIKGIADQTNLLALNAAIEAARAGDSGRGFAVVADEVRKLAEQTRQQSEGITRTIRNVGGQIKETAQMAALTYASVQRGQSATATIRDVYGGIAGLGNEVGRMTGHTMAQLQEQRSVQETMVQNALSLSQFIERVHAVAQYVAEISNSSLVNTASIWTLLQPVDASMRSFVLDRILDHARWLKKLGDLLDSGDFSAELADHTQCKLGKWYISDDCRELARNNPQFQAYYRQLDAPHAKLHQLGLQAVQQAKAGNFEQAQQLKLEALKHSKEVVLLLLQMAAALEG